MLNADDDTAHRSWKIFAVQFRVFSDFCWATRNADLIVNVADLFEVVVGSTTKVSIQYDALQHWC